MKKKFIFIFLGLFIISCETPVIEKIEKKFSNNQPEIISYYKIDSDKEIKIKEKKFYDTGKLKMEGNFLDGKRNGVWKAYFEDGQLQSEGTFEKGKRIGKSSVYFPNGQIRYTGNYENDQKSGHWIFYNEQGKIIQEKDF